MCLQPVLVTDTYASSARSRTLPMAARGAAWRVDGRAELVDRDRSVVGREGDVIEDRFGGGLGLDDAFHVCVIGG
jgi:hypothetical protein